MHAITDNTINSMKIQTKMKIEQNYRHQILKLSIKYKRSLRMDGDVNIVK